ncbi:PREDICTED: methionine aminopeptidase 1B, chloroplastic-like isoform X2 [Nelumbo nucifera]|nr:PREDICTED: methionine aminopeptidase 1B, chloroplastic-like isoform X2 [Nelumbo nucifera]
MQKHIVIISKKISGLEEAMRIRRERELRTTKPFRRIPPLRRGKVSAPLSVPDHIPKPPYVTTTLLPELSSEAQIHDSGGIAHMRTACELAARVLDYAGTLVRPSVTTNEIDKAVHKMIIDAGAYPSPLGYGGFPKSVCTSVNECMCHGIPDSRQLQDGDIINIDVTVFLNGYHGDTSKTFLCGNVNDATKRLVKVTEECLERAISVCKDGASFKKIGKRISFQVFSVADILRTWPEVAQSLRVRDKARLEWKPPEGNKVKLNFDGSYGNPGISRIGRVLRNSDRRILGMFSGRIGNENSLKAELLALLQGLKLAKQLGCRHVEVEGDSKVVISWATNSSHTPWTFKRMIREVEKIAKKVEAEFKWVRRSANGLADGLAKQGALRQQLFWAAL